MPWPESAPCEYDCIQTIYEEEKIQNLRDVQVQVCALLFESIIGLALKAILCCKPVFNPQIGLSSSFLPGSFGNVEIYTW